MIRRRISRFLVLQGMALNQLKRLFLLEPIAETPIARATMRHPRDRCDCSVKLTSNPEGWPRGAHAASCPWGRVMCEPCSGTGRCRSCGGDGIDASRAEEDAARADAEARA